MHVLGLIDGLIDSSTGEAEKLCSGKNQTLIENLYTIVAERAFSCRPTFKIFRKELQTRLLPAPTPPLSKNQSRLALPLPPCALSTSIGSRPRFVVASIVAFSGRPRFLAAGLLELYLPSSTNHLLITLFAASGEVRKAVRVEYAFPALTIPLGQETLAIASLGCRTRFVFLVAQLPSSSL
jgi:hypothetical protein